MNQKGFANIILLVLMVVLVGAVGYLTLVNKPLQPTSLPTPTLTSTSTPSPTPAPTITPTPRPSPTPVPTISKTGDIEEIQTLLNKEAWVRVIVMLKGNEFTAPEFRDDVKKKSEVQKIQNAVLVTLTKNDFQVSSQFQFSLGFVGMTSKSGMEKLLKDPRVTSISIDRLGAPN